MAKQYDEQLILAYIEGDLSEQQNAQFDQRLVQDARLRNLVAQLIRERQNLRGSTREQAPPQIMEAVNQWLERRMLIDVPTVPSRVSRAAPFSLGRWLTYSGVAAALVLSAGGFYATVRRDTRLLDQFKSTAMQAVEDAPTPPLVLGPEGASESVLVPEADVQTSMETLEEPSVGIEPAPFQVAFSMVDREREGSMASGPGPVSLVGMEEAQVEADVLDEIVEEHVATAPFGDQSDAVQEQIDNGPIGEVLVFAEADRDVAETKNVTHRQNGIERADQAAALEPVARLMMAEVVATDVAASRQLLLAWAKENGVEVVIPVVRRRRHRLQLSPEPTKKTLVSKRQVTVGSTQDEPAARSSRHLTLSVRVSRLADLMRFLNKPSDQTALFVPRRTLVDVTADARSANRLIHPGKGLDTIAFEPSVHVAVETGKREADAAVAATQTRLAATDTAGAEPMPGSTGERRAEGFSGRGQPATPPRPQSVPGAKPEKKDERPEEDSLITLKVVIRPVPDESETAVRTMIGD